MSPAQDRASSEATGSTFEQLLEAAPDAIVGVDDQGAIVLVNGQTEILFGYAREDLLGQPVEMLVPERFRELHPGYRAGYFAEPRTRPMGADLELYGRRRDGTEFPAEISLSSIDTDTGRLATAAIRDVSRRRAVERKFEQFLEFAPDAILGVAPGGEIVLVNQQTETLFGYARERADRPAGRDARPRALPRRPPRPPRRLLRASRGRGRWAPGSSCSRLRKDGTEFPAEISLSSIETEEGILATAAVRDISERAESEREKALQEQLDQARRLESVGQLAGGIAHDFNNILGVILNYAEFVGDELDPDSQARKDVERNPPRRRAGRGADPPAADLQPPRGRQAGAALPARRGRRAGEPAAPGAGRAGRAGDPIRRRPLRGRGRPRPDRAGARQPRGQRPRRDARRRPARDRGRHGRARRGVRRHAPRHRAGRLRAAEGERHRGRHGRRDGRSGPSSRSSRPREKAKAPVSASPPSTASSPAPAGGSTSTPSPGWARRSRSISRPARRLRAARARPRPEPPRRTRRGDSGRRGRARRAPDGRTDPHQGRLRRCSAPAAARRRWRSAAGPSRRSTCC